MNYKIGTLLISVLLMVIVVLLTFSDPQWVFTIVASVIPLLVIVQVVVILRSKDRNTKRFSDGIFYEND